MVKNLFYLIGLLILFSCGSSENKKEIISDSNAHITDTLPKKKTTQPKLAVNDTIFILTNEGNGKYGYKDSSGNWLIEPKFELAGEFADKLAPVLYNGKWHLMNKSGNFVFDFVKFKPIVIHNELSGENFVLPITQKTIAIEFEDGKQGFLKLFNRKITAKYDEVQSFNEGRAVVRIGEKWGYITLKGKFLVNPILDGAYSFSDKRGIIRINGLYGIINGKGQTIVKPSFRGALRYKEGVTFVTFSNEYKDYFLIGLNGEVINQGPYDQVYNLGFEKGECEVMMNGKCIVIDKKGNKIRDKKDGCLEGC
jgi:hypothetical protein